MLGKPPSRADAAIADFPVAIDLVGERWLHLNRVVVYKAEVLLIDRISSFMIPMTEGIEKTFASLREAPQGIVLMLVAMGIWKSGTHSRDEIEAALGVQLLDLPE